MRAERPIQWAPTNQRGADQFDLYDKGHPLDPFGMEHEASDVEAHEDQADDEPLNPVRCSKTTAQ